MTKIQFNTNKRLNIIEILIKIFLGDFFIKTYFQEYERNIEICKL